MFTDVKGDFDHVWGYELKTLGDGLRFLRQLWRERPDTILELHKSGRTSKLLRAYSFLSGARYLAHDHNKNTHVIFEQGVRKPIVQRDLDGAYTLAKSIVGKALYPNYLQYSPRLKHDFKIGEAIVLGVVATRIEKKWPLSHFVELVRLMRMQHPEVRVLIPLSSGAEDQQIQWELKSLLGDEMVEFIQVPLSDLPRSLCAGKLYIGNDTGLKHICAALGMKTWTLFGPEEPIEWHPYDYSKHPFLWIYGGDARDQMVMQCKLVQFDQSHTLSEISPEVVFRLALHDLSK